MGLAEDVQVLTVIAPQAVTATKISAPLDLQTLNVEDAMLLLSVGAITGTPTMDLKVQDAAGAPARGYAKVTAGANDIKLLVSATDNNKLGATFTQTGAKSIKYAYLQLKKNGTITAGKKLTLTLNANNAGAPGTVLGTAATVDIDTEVTTAYTWVKFTFATPVELANNTIYHIVLDGDYTGHTTNNVTWRSATVGSGGNQTILDNVTWGAVATEDFEVILEELTFADVAGFTMAQVTVTQANTSKRLALPREAVRRNCRVVCTIGGGSPNVTMAVVAIVKQGRRPTAAQA